MKKFLSLFLCLVMLLGLNGLTSANDARPEDQGAQPNCDQGIIWVCQ